MSKFGGGGGDGGAQAAAEQRAKEEAERKARIQQGLGAINDSFSGFNNNFYQTRAKAYDDYYQPQLQDQYEEAQENVMSQLARAGLLHSTAGNEARTDLEKQFALQRGAISGRGQSEASDFQSRINAERNALIAQLNASADPDIAASSAFNTSQALRDTSPTYSPLQQVLTPLAVAGGNYLEASKDARLAAQYGTPGATDPRAKRGTYTVG